MAQRCQGTRVSREVAARHRATFTEALDGEVEVLPPQPKRQREPVIIDLTGGESVTAEEASQDSGCIGHLQKVSQGDSSVDLAEQIRKLAKLRDGKLLTEDEFVQAKRKVLGLL